MPETQNLWSANFNLLLHFFSMENTPKTTPKSTPKSTPKKASKASYLNMFEKLNKPANNDQFEVRATSDNELYLKDPGDSSLIANDQSRETRRQAAVTLIEWGIENDFASHGLDEIPAQELLASVKKDAKVTLQSPVTLGDFKKLKPFVDSFIRIQEYKSILQTAPSEQHSATDPHQLAYREGQIHAAETLQGVSKKPSTCIDALKLFAAIGQSYQNNTKACQQLGALDVFIRQEIDRLNRPVLDEASSEFSSASQARAKHTELVAQYHGCPVAELALPVALLGAYAALFVEGGLELFVKRINREIEAEKKTEFTQFNPYFDQLELLKREYSSFEIVTELAFLKGKSHRDIVKQIKDYHKNLMLVLHTSQHTMVAGWTQYLGTGTYWLFDPVNGAASFSTAEALGDFLDVYLDANARYDRYGMKKKADGFHIDSVDVLTKSNANFGPRKNEFIDMLGLTASTTRNPCVTTTNSSSTASASTTSTTSTTRSNQTATTSKPTTTTSSQTTTTLSTRQPNPSLEVRRTSTTADVSPSLIRSPGLATPRAPQDHGATTTTSSASTPKKTNETKSQDKPSQ